MLCRICGKNPATTHIKTILNGALSESSICSSCALKLGCGGLLTDFAGSLLPLFGGAVQEESCDFCGATFGEIVRTGRMGCAECYESFYSRLLPALQRLHGSAVYRGKQPGENHLPQVREAPTLTVMRKRLREAIDAEDFEDAALLRDKIKELEGGGGDDTVV